MNQLVPPLLLDRSLPIADVAAALGGRGMALFGLPVGGYGVLTAASTARAMRLGLGASPAEPWLWRAPLYVAQGTALAAVAEQFAALPAELAGAPIVCDAAGLALGTIDPALLAQHIAPTVPAAAPVAIIDAEALAAALGELRWKVLLALAASAERGGLWLIGGVPRDLLLGRPIGDLDVVVKGDGIALARLAAAALGGRAALHPAFGTATIVLPDGVLPDGVLPDGGRQGGALSFDIVSARGERYDGAAQLPQIVRGTLRDDLWRRDFAINTLALSLGESDFGAIYDPCGGYADLWRGAVRALHPFSFVEDPTRVIRAARFAARLGFALDAPTAGWMRQAIDAGALALLTPARIINELRLLAREPAPERALALLDAWGALAAFGDGLRWDDALSARAAAARALPIDADAADLLLALAVFGLSEAQRGRLLERYKPSKGQRRTIIEAGELATIAPDLAGARPSAIERRLRGFESAALWAARLSAADATPFARYLDELRHLRPAIGGDDALALGIAAGSAIGRLLDELRAALIDGEVGVSAAEQRRWLAQRAPAGERRG